MDLIGALEDPARYASRDRRNRGGRPLVIIASDDGRQLHAGPTRPLVKVGPHLGASLLGVMESEIPPGGGFPPHRHDDYEEAFYVLAGNIAYFTDDVWVTAPAGTMVFAPTGMAHGFRNDTAVAARHLAITSPAIAMTMVEDLFSVTPEDWPDVLTRYRSRLED
jgi:quercetin dioxygenase-like cupin family protein